MNHFGTGPGSGGTIFALSVAASLGLAYLFAVLAGDHIHQTILLSELMTVAQSTQ